MILVVPTYDYLSKPIIELLLELKRAETPFVRLDFHQPRADFGLLPELPGFERSLRLEPDEGRGGVFALRTLRRRLLAFLDAEDPSLIVTFSDVTLFARFVNGTRFEERMLVIQPCLLSTHAPSLARKAKYLGAGMLNAALGCGVFRTQHYWGALLKRATYCVWSEVEQKSGHVAGRIVRCGRLFQGLPQPTEGGSETREAVLVLVPDLPYYSTQQLGELTRAYTTLLELHPDLLFAFKYHPRNEARLSLDKHANYRELQQFAPGDVSNYRVVISAFSNLAITLRFLHPAIIIFDLGWYALGPNPYLCSPYFSMPSTTEELLRDFEAVSRAAAPSRPVVDLFDRLFAVDESCIAILARYLDGERVRSHSIAIGNGPQRPA